MMNDHEWHQPNYELRGENSPFNLAFKKMGIAQQNK